FNLPLGTVLKDVALDSFGHLTAIVTANIFEWTYSKEEANARFVNVEGDTVSSLMVTGPVTANRVTITGTVTANQLVGDGSGLTNLNASAFSSGVLPVSRGGLGNNRYTPGQVLIGDGDQPVSTLFLGVGEFIMGSPSGATASRFVAGQGVSINVLATALRIDHADTSDQPSITPLGGHVVNRLDVDSMGHLTGVGTIDLDQRYLKLNDADQLYVSRTGAWGVGYLGVSGNVTVEQSVVVSGDLTVTGILRANQLIGSGAQLTQLQVAQLQGVLPVSNGGLGVSTLPSGAFLIGNGTGAVTTLGPLAPGDILMGRNGMPVIGRIVANQGIQVSIVDQQIQVSHQPGVLPSFRLPVGQVVSGLTMDDYGHVTGYQSTNLGADYLLQSGNQTLAGELMVQGIVSANQLVGDGSGLTHLSAAAMTGVLSVSQGGTGQSSIGRGVLVGDGVDPIRSVALAPGQLMVGGATSPTAT
ncbi:hypothetical protein EBZ35_08475, partial [bacterium]|nr:hypothetical protein [bacterium]